MARAALPVTQINRTGITPTAETTGDPVNNHTLANDGRTFLLVRNAHATVAQTVTVHLPQTVDGQSVTSKVVSVPATASRYLGPFPANVYSDLIQLDVSTVDVKLSAYALATS